MPAPSFVSQKHHDWLRRLQNGRFDMADRLFSSMAGAWDSVTSTAPDVKELIPEFFLRSPAFLTNRLQLALGTRQVSPQPGSHAACHAHPAIACLQLPRMQMALAVSLLRP